MQKYTWENPESEAAAVEEQPQDQPEEQPEKTEEESSDCQTELEAAQARIEEQNDQYLRLRAEFDNFRRRTQKEKEDFYKYAAESLLLELLPVLDNFQRAMEAKEAEPDKFAAGIEMIYRQMLEVLEKEGLKSIEALGVEFDPQKHEAVMQQPVSDEYSDNMISQELRRGYTLKEKVIRPAMVAVAKA